MRLLLLCAALLAPAPALAQPDGKVPPPRKMLYEHLRVQAQTLLDARRTEVAAFKTPAAVEKRQKALKARFLEALGGFPEKTPLNAQVVGTLKGDGYRIDRVIYESRPDHHVTANLYLPDGPGPFPGVLMPLGHSTNGKAAGEVQRACIFFAKNGLAVLAYDPIGQGERCQLLDAKGKPAIGSSTNEHSLIGVGALLVGGSTATYRIWDGIRSLDYLASRPEIDAKRLGCTGCSGGGTLTSYLMALDDRIVCAAPSCYLTTLERLFATLGPQDAEQNITGQVAFGMDHADYVLMRAPRPTLICAATRDFFDIQGTWTTFREAVKVYGLMGHPERVAIVEADTGHGYSRQHREAVLRWMSRWLLGKETNATEPDFPIHKEEDLWCTRSGQVLDDFKGKSAFYFNAERAGELARMRAEKFAKRTPDELRAAVRQLIGLPEKVPALRAEIHDTSRVKHFNKGKNPMFEYVVHKVSFQAEPDLTLPALWYQPTVPAAKARLVLYVHGDGKAVGTDAIERLVAAGDDVVALDLRGFGEATPPAPGKKPGPFGSDFKEAYLALHLNRPLLGQRVQELLAVVKWSAADLRALGKPVHVIGVGTAAPVVLHAAALEPAIASVILEQGVLSWTAVARTPLSVNQLTNVVPGALRVYDLPDLAAAIAPRPLTLHGVVDAKLEPAARADIDAAYAGARGAYEAHKAGERLSIATQGAVQK
jgi:dienelactone hydrolase/pimeloyl-ACP methyl ester carboxylesterase